MNGRIELKYFLPFFMVALCFPGFSGAQDFKTVAMGNVDLVLNHSENGLNLFRTTGNPADMLQEEKRNWMQFSLGGAFEHGLLHRKYDPERNQSVLLHFEGFKLLDDSQGFWGRVNYSFLHQYSVLYALEPHPYADDPLLVADSSSGSFLYDGPQIMVRYENLVSSHLSFGGELNYEISQGLKREYTRPRILQRNLGFKAAAAYDAGNNWNIGSYFVLQNSSTMIEFVTANIDGRTPAVRIYRSENVFRWIKENFQRYEDLRTYRLNSAVQKYFPKHSLQQLIQFNYKYSTQKAFDETSTKLYDSYWYSKNYNASFEIRRIAGPGSWNWGARFGWQYQTDWSRHPQLDILITERHIRSLLLEAGVSHHFAFGLPLLLALQVGYGARNDEYRDYQSDILRDLIQRRAYLRSGLEVELTPMHFLRFGFENGRFDIDTYSPRYLPDYLENRFTIGIDQTREKNGLSLVFAYFVKRIPGSISRYEGWQVILSSLVLP